MTKLQGWWQEAGDVSSSMSPYETFGVTVLPGSPTGLQTQWAEVQGKCLLHASGEVMRSPVSDFWNTAVAAENSQKGLSMCIIIRKRGREPLLMREKVNRA